MDLWSTFKSRILLAWTLFAMSIGIILFTAMNFQMVLLDELTNERDRNIIPPGFFDKTPVESLTKASQIIPRNETVVVSDHGPLSQYFLKHKVDVPYGADSQGSLLNHMIRHNLNYLLVYEGYSAEKHLKPLFSSNGLKELDNNFKEIANYSKDYGSIHVYKLIS